jgi:cardiolipin synthase
MDRKLALISGITISRFVLAPIFAYCYVKGFTLPAIIIALAVGLTDFLDGYLARKYKKTTALGGLLDTVADKFFFLVVLITFISTGTLSIWAALLIYSRDIIVLSIIALSKERKTHFRAAYFGKLITALQYILVLDLVLGAWHAGIIIIAIIALTPIALIQYHKIYIKN